MEIMLLKYVTLCLLITYHWSGSSASSTGVRSVPAAATAAAVAATASIAAEANGSPTDARLNIPVVKRSSNQAALANELRSMVRGERDARVVEVVVVVPTLFEPSYEYANRDGEKYPTEKLGYAEKLVEPSVVGKRVAEGENGDPKEKGLVVRPTKSSIRNEDAMPLEAPLIGEANSPPTALSPRPRFDYERVSAPSKPEEKRNEEETTSSAAGAAAAATQAKGEKKRSVRGNEEENNGESLIDSVFVPDASDSAASRIRREAGARRELLGDERRNSVLSAIGTIDNELEKQRKQRQEDFDASRVSHRLSSLPSLKLTEQPLTERSKLIATAELVNVLDSRRLHQQSRNTKPETITQHLRRNTKRQTGFYDNAFSSPFSFPGNINRASNFVPSIYMRHQRETNHQQIPNSPPSPAAPGPELRFIPADHRADNRIYFQRTVKPLLPSPGGSQDNRNDASPFTSNDDPNSEKIGRFSAAQIEKLKNSIRGVFDKYEARQQGQSNLLPNVRMIQSKQIFVAPPNLIYDTKILPAPFTFNRYFQDPSNNANTDNGNQPRAMEPGFAIKGVFDQSHKETELGQRQVIPVNEDSPPSLTNTRNFVTPLPPYQVGGDGEVSVRVNQAAEDPNVLDEIYRVRGNLGIPQLENESQRDEKDEDSRVNHESPIQVGANHHLGVNSGVGGRGSSYDNSAGTSANRGESGSTNVDHSAVIEGTTDEYVNRPPAVPSRTQSVVESNDSTYDGDSYNWRDDNDHNQYAANYSFGYTVSDYETENDFGHQETRKEGITKGKYHVRLPDGRIQKVNYHVDDGGYHASVSYHSDDTE